MVEQAASGVERRDELAGNLAAVHADIDAAAAAAGRDPADVTLIVVTKLWPASDVAALAELGVSEVGENRVQELTTKRALLPASPATARLRWHLIGALQTNKAKAAVLAADVIESVDRPKLVQALRAAADKTGRSVDCLIQVSLDPEPTPGRAGVAPDRVAALAQLVAASPQLRLGGVMGVAPNGGDAVAAFGLLARVAAELRSDYPQARVMSAGMSSDFPAAIAAGATHVRIGTAVLGRRRTLR